MFNTLLEMNFKSKLNIKLIKLGYILDNNKLKTKIKKDIRWKMSKNQRKKRFVVETTKKYIKLK